MKIPIIEITILSFILVGIATIIVDILYKNQKNMKEFQILYVVEEDKN